MSPKDEAITFINPQGLYDPSANGYSHAAIVPAAAQFAVISGQGGEAADGSLSPDFEDQVDQAYANLKLAAAAVGGGLHQVFKQIVLIVDHSEDRLAILAKAIEAAFGPGAKPCCTLIPVPRLALDGMPVEVEAWLALPSQS